jgi:carboxymethylenebutenolidase
MGEWTEVSGANGAFKAYVARPAQKTKAAVVVIQEIFGVNAVMRGKADWLAREGFLAICPDLFWRIEPGVDITDKTEAEWTKAMALMKAFDVDDGIRDIKATLAHAREQLGAEKVGAIGYCLGGLLAFLTACRIDSDASAGYYGVNIPQYLGEAEKLARPLLLHIAGADSFVPKQAQELIKQGLGNNPCATLHVYPDRDHAFTREGGKNYNADDARIADARTIAFFKEHLI